MSIEFTPNIGFSWTSQNGNTIEVEYPFPDPFEKIPTEENQIYILWAEQHKESEIITVLLEKEPAGFLFTVSAMLSTEPAVDNKYFRAAAWSVVLSLIENNKHNIEEKCESSGRLSTHPSSFIDEELSILTLHKPKLTEEIKNKPTIITPQLIKKGLIPYTKEETKTINNPTFNSPGKKLTILKPNKPEPFHDFHIDLLVNHIPYTQGDVFKFYLYYQIIESMMETVLASVCEDTLSRISAASSDPTISYDILEKHKERTNEKYRIQQVFSSFVTSPIDNLDILKEKCSQLLLSIDTSASEEKLKEKSAASLLYLVRNHLIHNFRRIGTSNMAIKEIIETLNTIIPDLLCKFEKKQTAPTEKQTQETTKVSAEHQQVG